MRRRTPQLQRVTEQESEEEGEGHPDSLSSLPGEGFFGGRHLLVDELSFMQAQNRQYFYNYGQPLFPDLYNNFMASYQQRHGSQAESSSS